MPKLADVMLTRYHLRMHFEVAITGLQINLINEKYVEVKGPRF